MYKLILPLIIVVGLSINCHSQEIKGCDLIADGFEKGFEYQIIVTGNEDGLRSVYSLCRRSSKSEIVVILERMPESRPLITLDMISSLTYKAKDFPDLNPSSIFYSKLSSADYAYVSGSIEKILSNANSDNKASSPDSKFYCVKSKKRPKGICFSPLLPTKENPESSIEIVEKKISFYFE